MGRIKNNSTGTIAFLLVIIALVLVILATPIVLFAGYLYNSLKVRDLKNSLTGTMSDFWLNDKEKTLFKENLKQASAVTEEIDNFKQKGEEAGISKNLDGNFSARSNLGKEIRTNLDRLLPHQNNLLAKLNSLQYLPTTRWNIFNHYIQEANAFFYAICTWAGVMIYFYILLGKNSITELFLPYLAISTNIFRDSENTIVTADGDMTMLATATILSIASYFIFKVVFRNYGRKYTPIPDPVTLSNIDEF